LPASRPAFAGEANGAVSDQNLGLADPAGIQQDLAGCRVARCILVADPETEPAERDPTNFAAPTDMNDPLAARQHRGELSAFQRRGFMLEPR